MQVALSKPVYSLERYYDRRLIRNIWRALRDERFNFLGGRVRFSGFVLETIVSGIENANIVIEGGSDYALPDGGISGKTIENFLDRYSAIFALDRTSGNQTLNTANVTLQYLHLFLWCRFPERVAKWEREAADSYSDLIVQNLDDSFYVFDTRKTFPFGAELLETSDAEHSQLAFLVEEHYQQTSVDWFSTGNDRKTPVLGVVLFSEVKNDVVSKCRWIGAELFHHIVELLSEGFDLEVDGKHRFRSDLMVETGMAVAFQTKDFVSSSVPEIPLDQSATVMTLKNKLSQKRNYFDIRIKELDPETEFPRENSEGEIFMASSQTICTRNGEAVACLPVHLSPERYKLLLSICNIIT